MRSRLGGIKGLIVYVYHTKAKLIHKHLETTDSIREKQKQKFLAIKGKEKFINGTIA